MQSLCDYLTKMPEETQIQDQLMREGETFAFQATIGQLMLLIINVFYLNRFFMGTHFKFIRYSGSHQI